MVLALQQHYELSKIRTRISVFEKKCYILPKSQFVTPITKYDLQCQPLINTSTQSPNIKILFKCDPSSWAETGVSVVEDRGFTNKLQK